MFWRKPRDIEFGSPRQKDKERVEDVNNEVEKTVKQINWPTAFVSTVLIFAGCFAYYIHHNCDHLI